MSETPQNPALPVEVGGTLHILETGFSFSLRACVGHVGKRGETVTVTPQLLAESWTAENTGSPRSWLQLDAAEQIEIYGAVQFGLGPWPENLEIGDDK